MCNVVGVVTFVLATIALVHGQSCKDIMNEHKKCVTEAGAAAVGITNVADIKDAVKQCYADAGCEYGWHAKTSDPPSDHDVCVKAKLGGFKWDLIQECVEGKGYEWPWSGDDSKSCSEWTLFKLKDSVKKASYKCPAAVECLKGVALPPADMDRDAARDALCAAKAGSCGSPEVEACEAQDTARSYAMCECKDGIDEQLNGACPKPKWGKPRARRGAQFANMTCQDHIKFWKLCRADFVWPRW